jgi:hypothetical protein
MQSENLLENETKTAPAGVFNSRSRKKGLLLWIQALTFLAGLALLGLLIYKVGYEKILEPLSAVGWGFVVILSLNLLRHFGRAASLYLSIEPQYRAIRYMDVVAARFAGEAVNFFSFAGPFLGDATRAVLLKRDMPLANGASAVIIDNILYYLSVIMMILVGVATLVVVFGSGSAGVSNALILIVVFCSLGFAALFLAISYRMTPASHAIRWLEGRGWAPGILVRKQDGILAVENNVFRFYHDRRGDFFRVFAISMSVHAVSVAEVYLALRFLGYEATAATSFIIESLTKVINVAFSFIPGTIGVYEGGNGIILQILGYTTAVGIALALVRRGAILFSTAVGMIVLVWRGAARSAEKLAKLEE